MNHPSKFDPPETVVPYAFTELLDRLRRTRQAGQQGSEISQEEREVFNFGVQQRKRVLEHTLFLVFGQWALYRQGISRLKSRGIRLAYGIGCVMSTSYFIKRRASMVTRDMFSNIVTTSTSSALGNEARIVLAELEGPEGPFFRSVCHEKGFAEDLTEFVNALDSGNEVDPTSDHLHPQFRLRPRLLTDGQTSHPPIFTTGKQIPTKRGTVRTRENQQKSHRIKDNDEWAFENDGQANTSRFPVKVKTPRDDFMLGPRPEWSAEQLQAAQSGQVDELTKQNRVDRARQRKIAAQRGQQLNEETDDFWGKPFDFSQVASQTNNWNSETTDSSFVESEDNELERDMAEMTPSQRRADERRRRRMLARSQQPAHQNDN